MTAAIQPQVFTILRNLIEERVGLRYGVEDAPIFSEKLMMRASDAGFESLLDYYYYLRYDPASETEFAALVDSLVVNETYFFREYDQLKVLADDFLLPPIRAGQKPRVWSAACSTGEEPFTIALILAEHGLLNKAEIIGTDISDRALARARLGQFGIRSFRPSLGSALAARWLEINPQTGRPTLPADIRESVQFQKQNLLDPVGIATLGLFDIILCRNVFIYFADATIQQVVENLSSVLRPGGVLCVGVSESLMRFGGPLVCEEHGGIFIYRKPA